MNQVRTGEVDGVRCFWVETGRPTLAARLVFRSGMVDEPFVESGWQHLIEHLALEGRGGGALQVNGSISLLETAFDAHGPAADVVAHLDGLSRWLSAPVLDRVEHEARVLRAEAALRGGDPVSEALTWRYGAAGPGLAGYHGPAVARASPALLAERAARVLTRGNAALVLDGPPPPGLRLHLPDGEPVPVPVAVPCLPEAPAAYVVTAGVVVSGVVRRSMAMRLGHGLLGRALREELRGEAGAAYAPWATYEPVDAEHCVVVGGSDVGPELMSTVVNRTLQLVRRLRALAPEADRLEEARAAYLQGMSDPFLLMGHAVGAAQLSLMGKPPRSADELADEARAVTGAAVRDAFEELHASLLLGVPGAATWDRPLPFVEARASDVRVGGRAWRTRNWPADATRLHVDAGGVTVRDGSDERTVPVQSVAGVLVYEEGVRRVVQHDGFELVLDPRDWHRGARAVERLDEVLPAELRLPQPGAPAVPAPVRLGVARRWAWPLTSRVPRLRTGRQWAALIGLVAAVLTLVLAVVARQLTGVGVTALVGVVCLRALYDDSDP